VELASGLDRLRHLTPKQAGHRQLADLDVSADGRLDAVDAEFFARLATAARAELSARGESLAVQGGLYHGIEDDAPAVFETLRAGAGHLDLAAADTAKVRELAIEARWLAEQVRVAALAGAAPLDSRPFGGVLLAQVPRYDANAMEPAAVCRMIDEIDVDAFSRAGLPVAALLDLDSTVWQGNVMDPFLAALAQSGYLQEDANPALRDYLTTLAGTDPSAINAAPVHANAQLLLERWTQPEVPDELRPSAKDMFYNIVRLMRGMTEEQATEVARAVFDTGASPFRPWLQRAFADNDGCHMRAIIDKMQARGIQVYLLSATLDVLAYASGRALGVPRERVVGSILEVRDGRYTGEVRDSAYYTKGAIARQWLPVPPLLVFGDSPHSDFSMLLEAAGASFMVNPRPELTARDEAEAGSRFVALWFDGTEAELPASE
jgi:phosphoserine phosphatase